MTELNEQGAVQQVINQPSLEDQLKTGAWTHGLCGCFDNLAVCIVAYFVPCVTFGHTHQRLYGDGCGLYGCLFTIPFVNCFLEMKHRGEIRQRRAIDGGAFRDCCLVVWCTLCTLVQEEQEALALESQTAALLGRPIIPPGGTVIIATGAPAPGYPQYSAPPPPEQGYPQYGAPPQYNQLQYNQPDYKQPQYGQQPYAQPYNQPTPDFKGEEMNRQ